MYHPLSKYAHYYVRAYIRVKILFMSYLPCKYLPPAIHQVPERKTRLFLVFNPTGHCLAEGKVPLTHPSAGIETIVHILLRDFEGHDACLVGVLVQR